MNAETNSIQIDLIPYHEIDAEIVDLIRDLNLADYRTSYSCQGDLRPDDRHGEGTAYISFVYDVPREVIDEALALGLRVVYTQIDDRPKTVAIHSQAPYSGPSVEYMSWRFENGIYRMVTNTRVHLGDLWTNDERIKHNREFQGKIRKAFGI